MKSLSSLIRKIIFILSIFFSASIFSQELNCQLVVDSKLTGDENLQIFKTLEKQLQEFVNNTSWTNRQFKLQEKINCNMIIIIDSYTSDVFSGSIQISSSRPVFNSTYNTPIYNFNDRNFTFRYLEFQNLYYNPTQYESNLISVIVFHIYMILGMDADTFSLNGGQEYYDQARTIMGYSQQDISSGWEPPKAGDRTRSALIDNVMSPTYLEFRTVMYQYHREGIDRMSNDPQIAKENISNILSQFQAMNNRRPNSFILRVFFDAKADEIQDIFTEGPSVNITELVTVLSRVAPSFSSNWREIKY